MSKQELQALLDDQQRFNEFAQAVFRSFDVNGNGYLCYDEIDAFLRSACKDFNQNPPSDEDIQLVVDYLRKGSEDKNVNLEQFKVFLKEVFDSLIMDAS